MLCHLRTLKVGRFKQKRNHYEEYYQETRNVNVVQHIDITLLSRDTEDITLVWYKMCV